MKIMKKKNELNDEKIKEAFRNITQKDGKIKKKNLIKNLCTYGNPLTIEEATEFTELIMNKDEIKIDDLLNNLN